VPQRPHHIMQEVFAPTFFTQILGRDCLCLGCRSADVDATVTQCCCCAVQCSAAVASPQLPPYDCILSVLGTLAASRFNVAAMRQEYDVSVPRSCQIVLHLFVVVFCSQLQPTFFINSAYAEGQDVMWWRQKDEIGWMKCIRGMDIML
jgi:hypothetical protein